MTSGKACGRVLRAVANHCIPSQEAERGNGEMLCISSYQGDQLKVPSLGPSVQIHKPTWTVRIQTAIKSLSS